MKGNIGNVIVLSVVALLIMSISALAVNNQPISKPVANPAKIYECEGPVELDGSASYDIDGGSLHYSWYRNGILFAEGKTVRIGKEMTDNSETHTFTLKVTDSGGAFDSKDTTLTVVSNPVPYIDNLEYTALSPETLEDRNYLTAGDIFELKAVKGKSNHGESYTWAYDEKIFQNIGSGNIVKFKVVSQSAQGIQKIEVIARNACGKESNRLEKKFEMRSSGQNSPPTSSIGLPSAVYEGKSFTMSSSSSKTGQGFSEQGDKIIKQRWEIRNSAGTVVIRSDSQNPTVTIENSGVFVSHLWVTDGFGAVGYSNESFPVFEAENDPSVANASATGKTAIFGRSFILNASFSSDPDGRFEDAIKRIEFWDMTYDPKDGDKLCSSSKPTCEVVFNRTGVHNIRLKVYDAGVMGEAKISDIKVKVVPSTEDKKGPSSDQIVSSEENAGTRSQQDAIDPNEILKNSRTQKESAPVDAKPAPAVEAVFVILTITVIARRMKN